MSSCGYRDEVLLHKRGKHAIEVIKWVVISFFTVYLHGWAIALISTGLDLSYSVVDVATGRPPFAPLGCPY